MKQITLQEDYIKTVLSGQSDGTFLVRAEIQEDDPVRLLSRILEGMDYQRLYAAYARHGRKPRVAPDVLFSILVYGYMTGIHSSRKLERACRSDIGFVWLLKGSAAPDHNTIARFRKDRLKGVAEDLFGQLVARLFALGEVRFENLFLDGTKIEASANRYTFVWKGSVEKHGKRLVEQAEALLSRLGYPAGPVSAESLLEAAARLAREASGAGTAFVAGRGRHKAQIQRDLEKLCAFFVRKAGYEKADATFAGRKSFSRTDPDATFMHLKEDHMRNGQLKPAYNVQLGVEGEYVIGVDISSERNDSQALLPFLERLKRLYPGKKPCRLVADAGYESEENYRHLEKAGIAPFVKPKDHDSRKRRKRGIGQIEAMAYDPVNDCFTCANGQALAFVSKRHRTSRSGFVSETAIYASRSCAGCGKKAECTKGDDDKQIEVNWALRRLRERSRENILSPLGILLRMNRSIQVEGAFGTLKQNRGFRRFSLRGRENVRTEWLLLCLGYNIQKLYSKMKSRRLGKLLHNVPAA